ncbi:hypothetical protein [Haloarchaeobius sp. DFWS5]|uniref:hypothetical protein n=1 Tax=Haloarchaeobius sp. DFWS5 TaxID=3446114 RepID=UPI003EB959CF
MVELDVTAGRDELEDGPDMNEPRRRFYLWYSNTTDSEGREIEAGRLTLAKSIAETLMHPEGPFYELQIDINEPSEATTVTEKGGTSLNGVLYDVRRKPYDHTEDGEEYTFVVTSEDATVEVGTLALNGQNFRDSLDRAELPNVGDACEVRISLQD